MSGDKESSVSPYLFYNVLKSYGLIAKKEIKNYISRERDSLISRRKMTSSAHRKGPRSPERGVSDFSIEDPRRKESRQVHFC